MRALPLPRKLSSAFRDMGELGRNTFTFASDVVGYLREFRVDVEAIEETADAARAAAVPLGVWMPDLPDDTLAYYEPLTSDEFDANELSSKWSVWDVAGIGSPALDTDSHMLRLTGPGNGSVRWSGIYQALPSSECAIIAKCSLIASLGGTGSGFGIFVAGDLVGSPSTADFRSVEFVSTGSTVGVDTRTWTAYNGTSSASSGLTNLPIGGYLRIRRDGTSLASDVSFDGVSWRHLATVSVGFTPTHMGISILSVDNTVTVYGYADFFRVFSGAGSYGINATRIGRLAA